MSFLERAASRLEVLAGVAAVSAVYEEEIVRLEADLRAIVQQVADENGVTFEAARVWLEAQPLPTLGGRDGDRP